MTSLGDGPGPHLLLPITFQPLLQREYADILQIQFNKRYTFPPGPSLPPPSSRPYKASYWRDEKLQSMKQRLNQCKAQLNSQPLQKWHKHTKRLNPAGKVAVMLKKQVQPELLTQAWEKFHECFHVFSLGPVPREQVSSDEEQPPTPFTSIHLCEAPGAFVTSLNHALSSHHPGTVWNWLATTLNPHFEGNDLGYMINDDRFIMGSLDHWHFGSDNTGDLMTRRNLSSLLEATSELEGGKVHLVTADGSIDCQGDPGRQESIVSDLHMAEVVAALNILSEGGNLVLKLFTMFESETVCLLYLLSISFTSLDVFKPATSKEGNSEVYVVARGLVRSNWLKDMLEDLDKHFGDFPTKESLFAQSDIPSSFLGHVRGCADMFMQLQENVIENNLHYFKDPLSERDMKDLAEIQLQVAEKYMDIYKVEEVAAYRHCVYRRRDPHISQMDPRSDRGTYLDKVAETALEPEARLTNIRTSLQGWKVKGRVRFVEWVGAPVLGQELDTPVVGRRLAGVRSSKFCTGSHLQLYNNMVDLLEIRTEREGSIKRRKMDKTVKTYQGVCKNLSDYKDDVRILKKLSAIFPEIVEKSKVLFLSSGEAGHMNMLSEECRPDNQIRLISTIIEAVTGLARGEHLLVQGFPLYTRLCMAIFFCLSALFEETGFVRPQGEDDFVFLSNFLGSSNTADDSLQRLESILTRLLGYKGQGQVLSVWTVPDLVQEPLYSGILLFNQLRIKEKVILATDFLEPEKPNTEKESS